ncbi:MAG: sugar-phosphatase [Yoonia sp.]|jgi:HAD superfamily hydrolase (TIGR01509 family)
MTNLRLSQFRAAIFDLDGTLVLSEPAWELAKRRVLDTLGVTVPHKVYAAFVGRGVRGFLTHVLGSELSDARCAELVHLIGAEADILLPQMRQCIPGASDAVKWLASEGLRVAVCSSSPRRHIYAALAQLGLTDCVSVIVSGAELSKGKPDPLPYLETLRQLNHLSAAEAFCVEDALPGVLSARAAGLMVIGIGDECLKPEFAPLCRHRLRNYQEFNLLFANS